MKRCLIMTGGKLDLAFARAFLEKETFDKIIAVDGGLKAVKELGLVPDYIVGDFDSVSNEIREDLRRFSGCCFRNRDWRSGKNRSACAMKC